MFQTPDGDDYTNSFLKTQLAANSANKGAVDTAKSFTGYSFFFFFPSLFSHEKTFHRVWLKFQQGSLFPALLPNSEVEEILISKSIHKQWASFNFSLFFPLKNFDFMVDWYFEWVCKPSSKLDDKFWMTFAWIEFLAHPPLSFI